MLGASRIATEGGMERTLGTISRRDSVPSVSLKAEHLKTFKERFYTNSRLKIDKDFRKIRPQRLFIFSRELVLKGQPLHNAGLPFNR